MSHPSEPTVNSALGRLLQGMLPGCQVRTQHTSVIDGRAGLQPDILITAAGRSPVVIEAEHDPAANVEAEAQERLGLEVETRPIESAIALRYPAPLKQAADHESVLGAACVSYGVFTQEGTGITRFPSSGWLDGSIEDVADLIRLVSAPRQAVDRAAQEFEEGIDRAANTLEAAAKLRPAIGFRIAKLLGMTNVGQTWRMAGAIIANALIFHERLAGMHEGVRPLELVGGDPNADLKRETLAAWTEILDINYWPIFSVARDIVSQLESHDAVRILRTLYRTATQIRSSGVDNAHDLTGRVFQRLIADRKYLATFYTLPPSAALLARLAVAKLKDVDWSDPEAVGNLRVGDFACGTGALLSAVYEQIAARHERAGGDAAALHAVMMEEVLYGCDVMPSAIHITGSTLAGAQASGKFRSSRLYTLNYGRQRDGSVAIGSLELLRAQGTFTTLNTSDPARRTGSAGEETAAQIAADVPHESFDLVIMNPPFTRAGSDWEGSERSEDYVKQFRGLSTELGTQKQMAKRLGQQSAGTCYHGYAGIASAFAALADRKLKPGGVLALVLPLSAAAGISWQGFRRMLAARYTDLAVLSIAASDNDDLSFSADTGMAECLVIARKRKDDEPPAARIHFTSLTRRPQGFAHAGAIANSIRGSDQVRAIDDGPYGGTPLHIGDELVGSMLVGNSHVTDTRSEEQAWGEVRITDYSLAQTAHALTCSRLWLPGNPDPLELSVAPLGTVGERGMHDMNIAGKSPSAPFSKGSASATATYPALWSHNSRNEIHMACAPDSQVLVKPGMEARAAEVWPTASRAHVSRGFRFTSQPLAAAFTDRECIGGRGWPNVKFKDPRFDYAFTVWGNSTLGLLSYWWHASRQVSGRGDISVSAIETLPILDVRTLSHDQLIMAELIFDELRHNELKPAYLADADPNRALLDRRVVCDLLEFDETVYEAVRRLSAKWCAEPAVHGGKPRPPNAEVAV